MHPGPGQDPTLSGFFGRTMRRTLFVMLLILLFVGLVMMMWLPAKLDTIIP